MTKSTNYTAEETALVRELYEELGNEGLPQIAEQVNKTINSVRAKLVREHIYVAPEKPARQRKNGPSKKEILRELEELGFPQEGLDGLQGATKTSLSYVKDFIKEIQNE